MVEIKKTHYCWLWDSIVWSQLESRASPAAGESRRCLLKFFSVLKQILFICLLGLGPDLVVLGSHCWFITLRGGDCSQWYHWTVQGIRLLVHYFGEEGIAPSGTPRPCRESDPCLSLAKHKLQLLDILRTHGFLVDI